MFPVGGHPVVHGLLVLVLLRCVFFFFQAEDGIRDLTVTGVQTCALPISRRIRENAGFAGQPGALPAFPSRVTVAVPSPDLSSRMTPLERRASGSLALIFAEIGRASCRERV